MEVNALQPRWDRVFANAKASRRLSHDSGDKLGRFEAFGPFDLPIEGSGALSDKAALMVELWREVEGRKPGLSAGCGCFVVSVLHRDSLPLSVGAAVTSGFRQVLQGPGLARSVTSALGNYPGGTVHVHLIAKLTPQGHIAKPSARHRSDIVWLERFVVAFASKQNENLITSRPVLTARLGLTAEAILGPAEYSTLDQRAFRRLLGL